MPKKKDKLKDCVEIRICVSDELNEKIERLQANNRLKGVKLKKDETVVEFLIENMPE